MFNDLLVNVITEEINKFDFLDNDKFVKEQKVTDLLQNQDLQKQFITDSLLNRNAKIKIINIVDSQLAGDWGKHNTDYESRINLEYHISVEYSYDSTKEPLEFNLLFESNDISLKTGLVDDINWGDIDVSILTIDSDEIKFVAFDDAPPKIKMLFIREYTYDFIKNSLSELSENNLL